MRMNTRAMLLSLPLLAVLAACGAPKNSQTAADVRDNQVASDNRAEQQRDSAGESAEKTANSTGDAMGNAGKSAAQTANRTGEAIGDAGSKVADNSDGVLKGGAQTANNGDQKENKDDASSDTRRRQLNSDIRAREQREGATDKISDGDIESKVRSKLEANLQNRAITVKANDGVVTLQGKVGSQAEVTKAVELAKQINGVKTVQSKLTTGSNAG